MKEIEKQLFMEEEPCPEKIKEKQDAGEKTEKEIIEWKPMENKVRKEKETDELAIKCFASILILILPFILLYELGESLWFRCSSKRRKEEFRRMGNERTRYARKPKPENGTHDFFKNDSHMVIHYSTCQDIYPECDISVWVPEAKTSDYPRVPWLDTMELYSIKVPYTFHSYWADGYVSDIKESDWLSDFKVKWNLVNAIAVINYNADGYECLLRSSKAHNFIKTFPYEIEDLKPLECFVELLIDRKPVDVLNWEKMRYRRFALGRFRLERRSYDHLTGSSRKKFERILNEYGLPKFCLL